MDKEYQKEFDFIIIGGGISGTSCVHRVNKLKTLIDWKNTLTI